MTKLIILLACVTSGLFGSTESVSFQCNFQIGEWGSLGNVYAVTVQNSVSITSPEAAQVDSVSGIHLDGYNNDNVGVFSVGAGQIYYFPRKLDKIFKNLKGIQIINTGIKEIHKSDLKALSNLRNLWLHSNNLELLEENLFEFNPNLELISLSSNKISHIDSNVFDKLTKLRYLYLYSNTCINMDAVNDPTEVQIVIRTAKAQCTNSDYLKLEQKVKNLEIEANNLNAEKLKKKLQNLENEVKISKFSNFFKENLQDLRTDLLQTKQNEKSQREVLEKIAKIDEKLRAMNEEISNLKNDVSSMKDAQPAVMLKLDKILKLAEEQNQKTTSGYNGKFREIESSNSQNFAAIMNFVENLSKKMDAIEDKLARIDST